jgi:hypothetical protein
MGIYVALDATDSNNFEIVQHQEDVGDVLLMPFIGGRGFSF